MSFAIRNFHPSDLPVLYRICLETGQSGADATGLVDPEVLGHYFVGPYAVLEPDLVSILTMQAEPVGYIVGTADTRRFESACEAQWWPVLRHRYPMPAETDTSRTADMIRAMHAPATGDPIAERYPAHLHINILPPGQGCGQGRVMINHFVKQLEVLGVPGLHFGVSAKNEAAIGFYTHLGFDILQRSGAGIQMGREL